ncbi:hypothetical protein BDA99DRAFT_546697 [Phascolomyces articulosus]|uniref:chitin deacetylase n=1 Tax=Phascolomyces articulosus TaxID=60185 RepID=A0AAD5KBP7_9FUNG|nr:hypothetical protein BDA99DRAFT_546697 [Phascolomyces articulosus]
MYLKASIAISLVISQVVCAADYWEAFKSTADPTKLSIPKIAQTSSHDPVTECQWYEPPTHFKYNAAEWPTTWELATSNGMSKNAEFKKAYNAVNWSNAPNITVRKLDANGAPDMSDYDAGKDPDCWWTATTCTIPKHKDTNADIYSCPEPETWGLNFDDGPNCSHNAFYDYLEQNKLKASMFYIGSNVVNWPYGAIRGVIDGHHIAQHTWSHNLMTTLTNEEVFAELYFTQKAIKMVTGLTPLHWRPAFGDVDDRVRWIATQLGLTTILWDLDTDDWAAGESLPMETVQKNYENFIDMGTNGTFKNSGNIVLQHEIDNTTMSLAIDYLPKIQKAYKHVVDIATCQNITYPYQEKSVKFASFANATKTKDTDAKSSSAPHSSATASSTIAAQADEESAAVGLFTPYNLIMTSVIAGLVHLLL